MMCYGPLSSKRGERRVGGVLQLLLPPDPSTSCFLPVKCDKTLFISSLKKKALWRSTFVIMWVRAKDLASLITKDLASLIFQVNQSSAAFLEYLVEYKDKIPYGTTAVPAAPVSQSECKFIRSQATCSPLLRLSAVRLGCMASTQL